MTVDPEIPVPPLEYGGIERIVDSLVTAYSQMGHEVYLIAHRASKCQNAVKIFGWPGNNSRGIVATIKNALFLLWVTNRQEPDIIHSFSRLLYLYPIFFFKATKVVQSYQRAISKQSTSLASFIGRNQLYFTACGGHMIRNHPIASRCQIIYNFTDTDFYQLSEKQGEYLVYLGRIEEIKGAREAIQASIGANVKLIIAGNIQPGHNRYFDENVRPFLGSDLVEYVGGVNDEQKRELFAKAKAFLFPIKWDEPFGIVMVEAMACGVPVIGHRRGSVPEVLIDGETGFVVDNTEEMINAIKKIDKVDRQKVRDDCEARFSKKTIANEYIGLFRNFLAAEI